MLGIVFLQFQTKNTNKTNELLSLQKNKSSIIKIISTCI